MEACANITVAAFAAHLRCPTKGYLLAHGEKPSNSFFADLRRDLSAAYKAKVGSTNSVNFLELAGDLHNMASALVNSENHILPSGPIGVGEGQIPPDQEIRALSRLHPRPLFCLGKVDQSDDLLVASGPWQSGRRPEAEFRREENHLRRNPPREDRQDRRPPPENATGHRGNRVDLPGQGTTPARPEQALPGM